MVDNIVDYSIVHVHFVASIQYKYIRIQKYGTIVDIVYNFTGPLLAASHSLTGPAPHPHYLIPK